MELNSTILLCTELDRTLFRRLTEQAEVHLAYVRGRDQQLLLDTIAAYALPVPDYAIQDSDRRLWDEWHEEIVGDWDGHTRHAARIVTGQQRTDPAATRQTG